MPKTLQSESTSFPNEQHLKGDAIPRGSKSAFLSVVGFKKNKIPGKYDGINPREAWNYRSCQRPWKGEGDILVRAPRGGPRVEEL